MEEEGSTERPPSSSSSSQSARSTVRRPPSYASEDGVSYIVDAQPRSIAPTTDVPLSTVHPSEAGRAGSAAEW